MILSKRSSLAPALILGSFFLATLNGCGSANEATFKDPGSPSESLGQSSSAIDSVAYNLGLALEQSAPIQSPIADLLENSHIIQDIQREGWNVGGFPAPAKWRLSKVVVYFADGRGAFHMEQNFSNTALLGRTVTAKLRQENGPHIRPVQVSFPSMPNVVHISSGDSPSEFGGHFSVDLKRSRVSGATPNFSYTRQNRSSVTTSVYSRPSMTESNNVYRIINMIALDGNKIGLIDQLYSADKVIHYMGIYQRQLR